jgi:hypothetical protein
MSVQCDLWCLRHSAGALFPVLTQLVPGHCLMSSCVSTHLPAAAQGATSYPAAGGVQVPSLQGGRHRGAPGGALLRLVVTPPLQVTAQLSSAQLA